MRWIRPKICCRVQGEIQLCNGIFHRVTEEPTEIILKMRQYRARCVSDDPIQDRYVLIPNTSRGIDENCPNVLVTLDSMNCDHVPILPSVLDDVL